MALDLYHDSIMNTFLQVKTSDIKKPTEKKTKKTPTPRKKTLKRCLIEKYTDNIDQCLVF